MQHDTAGDPMTGIKWSRRTTRKIAEQLATLGIAASKNTVGRLLKQLRHKLRVNRKQIASSKSPVRNQQFLYIGHPGGVDLPNDAGIPRSRPREYFRTGCRTRRW